MADDLGAKWNPGVDGELGRREPSLAKPLRSGQELPIWQYRLPPLLYFRPIYLHQSPQMFCKGARKVKWLGKLAVHPTASPGSQYGFSTPKTQGCLLLDRSVEIEPNPVIPAAIATAQMRRDRDAL